MIIAIDYDGTYATDPVLFNSIINLFKAAGHTVICVTGRSAGAMGQPVLDSIGKLVPVVFAGTEWKARAAQQAGYTVSIWIDDMPGMISPVDII